MNIQAWKKMDVVTVIIPFNGEDLKVKAMVVNVSCHRNDEYPEDTIIEYLMYGNGLMFTLTASYCVTILYDNNHPNGLYTYGVTAPDFGRIVKDYNI